MKYRNEYFQVKPRPLYAKAQGLLHTLATKKILNQNYISLSLLILSFSVILFYLLWHSNPITNGHATGIIAANTAKGEQNSGTALTVGKKAGSVSSTTRTVPQIVIQAPQSATSKVFGVALGDTLPALSATALGTELNGIASLGAGWIRIDMSWADVQPQNASSYNWSDLDRVVAAASARHIKVLAILDYTPSWARVAGCSDSKCAPANDSAFASYASAAASRYAPQGVQDWEIWNEPNLEGSWQPQPDPQSYEQLLQASYQAIKNVEPNSTVITGGVGPLDGESNSIDQLTFLNDLYADGAKPYFDAVGYHPYSYPAPPDYVINWNSWSTLADLPNSVRSIMTANGDSAKQVWITEYGAPTGGPGALATTTDSNFNAGPDHVDEALQAEMVAQATTEYKADSWMGGFFWYSYQDLGTSSSTNENFFGLLRYDGSQKPAYTTYQSAIKSP